LTHRVRLMLKDDIKQIEVIDREAFPSMWPPVNFQGELTNKLAHYVVVCDGTIKENKTEERPNPQPGPVRTFLGFKLPFGSKAKPIIEVVPVDVDYIAGFAGTWLMLDEAHIISIAVREAHRGRGVGELLLISSIDLAKKLNARIVTLEVRVSNSVAQNLYTKYGFNKTGTRKKYYTDNNEDAFIMTTDDINSSYFQEKFQALKQKHFEKNKDVDYRLPA
jgi:[ribosomal protein S18]-alanine N-acetyltransferase